MIPAPISKISADDKKKLEELFVAYSERIVADIAKRLAYGAEYPSELNAFFVQHSSPAESRTEFSSQRIEKARTDFAKALAVLSVFVRGILLSLNPARTLSVFSRRSMRSFAGTRRRRRSTWNGATPSANWTILVEKMEIPYRELLFIAKMTIVKPGGSVRNLAHPHL